MDQQQRDRNAAVFKMDLEARIRQFLNEQIADLDNPDVVQAYGIACTHAFIDVLTGVLSEKRPCKCVAGEGAWIGAQAICGELAAQCGPDAPVKKVEGLN